MGLDMTWTDQLVPFQRSATKVLPLAKLMGAGPTAMHAVAEVHDTPLNDPDVPPGLGVVWTDQPVPFHRSASVVPPGPPPTAVHAVAEVHDTALRLVVVGSAVVWIDQLVPSQRSTNVGPNERPENPNAVQAVAELHETPSSWL
jgi:hypothetical protein